MIIIYDNYLLYLIYDNYLLYLIYDNYFNLKKQYNS